MKCYIAACKTAARCHVLFKIQQQNLFAEVSPSDLSVLWWEALKHPIERMESKPPWISAYSHRLLSVSVGQPDTETLLHGWAVEQLSSPQDMPQESPAAQRLPGAHHFASSLQGESSLPCAQTQQHDKHWAHHFHRSLYSQRGSKSLSLFISTRGIGQVGTVVCLPSAVCSTADGHEHEAAVKQVRSSSYTTVPATEKSLENDLQKKNIYRLRKREHSLHPRLPEAPVLRTLLACWHNTESGPRIHVLDCVLWQSKPEAWSESFWNSGNSNSGADFVYGSVPNKIPMEQVFCSLKIKHLYLANYLLPSIWLHRKERKKRLKDQRNTLTWFLSSEWIV